jgi:16S rRNA (guanine1516-N2)-methyltransferase
VIVTTSYEPSPELLGKAKHAASRLNVKLAVRGRQSVAQLLGRHNTDRLLLIAREGVQLIRAGEPPLFFHPSMAAIRLKRLGKGEPDPMLEAARVQPGDNVLDCTAGLGSDSIVFAYGVGPEGTVTALESEPVIAYLVSEGLATYDTGDAVSNTALRRIRLLHADHLAYLRQQPDRSVDVVYFDPMFRKAIDDSSSMSPLRQLANDNPLSPESICEAKRVARKTVVLKEQKQSEEFKRLGFTSVLPSSRKLAYGVIQL